MKGIMRGCGESYEGLRSYEREGVIRECRVSDW